MKQITRLKLLCSTLKITALLAAIAASLFFENVNAQFDGGVADSRNIKVIGKGPGIEPGNVIPCRLIPPLPWNALQAMVRKLPLRERL